MSQTETIQMKTLTKIRLINWHYFTDETIDVKGSVLFSGENASGKSTILDAIQLVLTTSSKRFNPAANEKSKRDLEGYVRCKTGEEGNTFLRANGPVISYVALEFYEQSMNRFFVIGVKIDSHNIGDSPIKKWFCVDGEMNTLTFIVDGKPALDKEFTQNGKRVQFESQESRAREIFRIRLGRLDEKFGEKILKAMAFKPMNKVKDFINNYILPEKNIETGTLQENILHLRDMQKLIDEVKSQIKQLDAILKRVDTIDEINHNLRVADILISIAKLEKEKQELSSLQRTKSEKGTVLTSLQRQSEDLDNRIYAAEGHLRDLKVALNQNECGQLIVQIQERLNRTERDIRERQADVDKYAGQLRQLREAVQFAELSLTEELRCLQSGVSTIEERAASLDTVSRILNAERDSRYNANAAMNHRVDELDRLLSDLEGRIESLKKSRLVFDSRTTELLKLINAEFSKRGIDSKAEIFCNLLEINPELGDWQDAVEGYLNTQRFNIIVDPQYFDIAADVYERNRDRIHSVGLVNVEKLMANTPEIQDNSLYEVVTSENRFARAYASYLLGRVVRCGSVRELKGYAVSVTRECMKYQGHVLQKIDEAIYRSPFIGKHALQVQLENAERKYGEFQSERTDLNQKRQYNETVLKLIQSVQTDVLESTLDASIRIDILKKQKQADEKELAEAKKNPSFIDLSMKCDAAEKALETIKSEKKTVEETINKTNFAIWDAEGKIKECGSRIANLEREKADQCADQPGAEHEALEKYEENIRRNRTPATIAENYSPRRQTLVNQLVDAKSNLIEAQVRYKDGDYGTGLDVIGQYREEYDKLTKSDLITYEDKLAQILQDCQLEFHENFLAKMRENIDQAKNLIRQLNKSLQGIFYGNDSYRFELTANKDRQRLYEMITSEFNFGGTTLFTAAFDEQYHNEMEELFSQLADENLNDSKVIHELTDYRSYLDYDIQVISRDGKKQWFSRTYGEKSGGETQTPYYVAIAASFAQMYSGRETVRLILLDEAFNNMDEDRIESMMQFLTAQQFQIVLATPPARMEIIGEHVNSIYLTLRRGNCSTVEEYFL